MKKIFGLIVFSLILFTLQISFASRLDFSYAVHVQDIGWMRAVRNGEIAGTTGRSLRMEAIVIDLTDDDGRDMVEYCAHVQNIGWQGWVNSGEIAGTTGRDLRMEAVRIKLKGRYANKFDIYYRAHVQDGGWLGWAKNGEPAGTAGAELRMEAIQIKILPKGEHFDRGGRAFFQKGNRYPQYI